MWPWDRRVQLLVLILAGALVFAGGARYAQWLAARAQDARTAAVVPGGQAAPAATVAVHVTGAVSRPGVYYLPSGSRVNDAVEKAGLLPDADTAALNLARKLSDGEPIHVPLKGEQSAGAAGEASSGAGGAAAGGGGLFGSPSKGGTAAAGAAGEQGDKLNINTATAGEMDARLPGIGPVLAKRIVDYRTANGPFKSIDDLRSVSGIGPSRFEQIRDYVTI